MATGETSTSRGSEAKSSRATKRTARSVRPEGANRSVLLLAPLKIGGFS